MRTAFKNIIVGAAFYCNGNYCIKRSSRTADLYELPEGKRYGRFYFRQGETCYSRLAESKENPPSRTLRTP